VPEADCRAGGAGRGRAAAARDAGNSRHPQARRPGARRAAHARDRGTATRRLPDFTAAGA